MKLVIGLGNPGRKYVETRHNIGFAVLAELASRCGQGKPRSAFQAEVVDGLIGSEKVLLMCPQTFMNLSGASVLGARDFYKLADEDILVVCDDFNLPIPKLRMRGQGSAGGQKGLADIIRRLGTEAVPRLRVGVGPLPAGRDPADFVLGRFTKEEQEQLWTVVPKAATAIEDWVRLGIQSTMNQYN